MQESARLADTYDGIFMRASLLHICTSQSRMPEKLLRNVLKNCVPAAISISQQKRYVRIKQRKK